jgi:hypothetical protein
MVLSPQERISVYDVPAGVRMKNLYSAGEQAAEALKFTAPPVPAVSVNVFTVPQVSPTW